MITTNAPTTTTAPSATLFAGSSRFAWHQTAASTEGVCAVAEIHVRPGGEPPVHVHGGEDELYVVLAGEITFSRGGELIDAGPGTSVFLPRGVEHGFVVRSEQAHVLMILTPGGLELAFDRLGVPTDRDDAAPPAGPPSPDEVLAFNRTFAEFGVTFTGPPLAALLAGAPRA
jgi:quercetin dioxygenase-like cupin family protein